MTEIVVGKILRFLTVEGSDGSRMSWAELLLGELLPDLPNLPWFYMQGHPHSPLMVSSGQLYVESISALIHKTTDMKSSTSKQ